MTAVLLLLAALTLATAAVVASTRTTHTRREDRPAMTTDSTTPSTTRPELDRADRRDALEQYGREAARQLWLERPANAAEWRQRFRFASDYRPPLAGELDLLDPSWRQKLDPTAVELRAVELWHQAREAEQLAAAAAVDAAEQQRVANACPVCGGQRGVPLTVPVLPGAEPADVALCWPCRQVVALERVGRLSDQVVRDGHTRGALVDGWLTR